MSKNYNIILVENESDIIKLTQSIFEIGGFENVDVATKGEEFLKKLNDGKKYDLVLLDIMLTDKNGVEILKFIKGNEIYKNMKIVAFTAIAEKEKIIEFYKAGADTVIIKPFDPYEFLEKIKEIIRAN